MKVNDEVDYSKILDNIDQIIKPLSNDTRVKLLILLKNGPVTYSDLLHSLNLESGSFYWHIKKMALLILQTEDKMYYLSEFGKKAYDLLISDGTFVEVSYQPDWYLTIRAKFNSFFNLPTWILFQQLIILLFIIAFFYNSIGFNQFGSMVYIKENSLILTLLTILFSILLVSFLIFSITQFYLKVQREEKYIDFRLFIELTIASLPLLLIGIIIGLFELLDFQFAFHPLVQFISSLISIFLATIFCIIVLDNHFDFGFVNSGMLILLIYYPFTLLSFLLAP